MKKPTFLIVRITIPLFLYLLLISCGSGSRKDKANGSMGRRDSAESKENGMMRDMMGDNMMQDGMMSEEMRKAMMSEELGPEMMEDMRVIRSLLVNHEQIERQVENLDNGVKTWTTSDDPEIVAVIQKHVKQMHERMKENKPIRQMDPLFRELFEQANKIEFHIENIPDGVIVTETSEDPEAVKLIRQHANGAVNEFVEKGMQRAMQPTPLPKGYQD